MTIDYFNDEIRKLVNTSINYKRLVKDKNNFNRLHSSMDIIGDTECAISYFKNLDKFNSRDRDAGYLFIYGLLHALYLQQNAVDYLNKSLFGKKIDYKKTYPKLYKVRNIRNKIIGHPISTNENNVELSCVISRESISREGFDAMDYKNNKIDIYPVDLNDIIEKQKDGIFKILEKIKNNLEKEI